MKITIKITEYVPYTTTKVVSEASISAEEIDQDVLGETVKRLRADVDRRVAEEMERRGIVLGADGLRLERPQQAHFQRITRQDAPIC